MMWSARSKAQGWDSQAQSLFRYMLLAAAVFVAPHAIALLLFLIPPISRALESSNFPLLRTLTSGLQVRLQNPSPEWIIAEGGRFKGVGAFVLLPWACSEPASYYLGAHLPFHGLLPDCDPRCGLRVCFCLLCCLDQEPQFVGRGMREGLYDSLK